MNSEKVNISKTNKKANSQYVYSILGVALVLFLLGFMGYLIVNAGMLSKMMRENLEISVILNDNTRDANAQDLKKIIEAQSFSKSTTFVSKENAATQFQKEFGDNFMDVLDYNPLYTSINFKVHDRYMNKDSLVNIANFIQQSNIVREVTYPRNIVDVLQDIIKKVGIILLLVSIMLIVAVIFLIDNTIKLAMFSNRFLIKTMQQVGATRFFIARPFNVRAILNGVISAVLAILGILAIKGIAENWLPELHSLKINAGLTWLCIIILLLGVLISLFSTHRSVIKYLKTSLDDLY
jgi:cell division transport system permease protein